MTKRSASEQAARTHEQPAAPSPHPGAEDFGSIPANVVEASAGQTLALGSIDIEYKLRAEDGAGFSMIVYGLSGRFEAPPVPHWHTREHFVAFVLEGELVFHLAQGARRLSTGASLHVPAGAPFAWSNPHDAPARFLCLWSPGGFERFFEEVVEGIRQRAGSGPPPPEAMREVIPPLWEKYGVEDARAPVVKRQQTTP